MRISDWSSDVCSSDLARRAGARDRAPAAHFYAERGGTCDACGVSEGYRQSALEHRGAGLTIPGDVPTSLIQAASFRLAKMAMDIRVSGHQVDVGGALQQQSRARRQGMAGKYFSLAIAPTVPFGRGPHDNLFPCALHRPYSRPARL